MPGKYIYVSKGVQNISFFQFGPVFAHRSFILPQVEAVCPNQIKVIDIGGGLSTTYIEVSYGVFFLPWILYSFHNQIVVFILQKEEPKEFAYSEYRKKLEEVVPQLLSGRFVISITCICIQICICIFAPAAQWRDYPFHHHDDLFFCLYLYFYLRPSCSVEGFSFPSP